MKSPYRALAQPLFVKNLGERRRRGDAIQCRLLVCRGQKLKENILLKENTLRWLLLLTINLQNRQLYFMKSITLLYDPYRWIVVQKSTVRTGYRWRWQKVGGLHKNWGESWYPAERLLSWLGLELMTVRIKLPAGERWWRRTCRAQCFWSFFAGEFRSWFLPHASRHNLNFQSLFAKLILKTVDFSKS